MAVSILGLCKCGAASSLIHYERLRYLSPPPANVTAESLVQASDGRIYGALHSRDDYAGVLFSVDADGSNYSVQRSSPTNRPSGVVEGRDGRLYGTVAGDPRTNVSGVFRIDRDGNNYTLLRTFSTGQPWSGVVQDSDDWLYGTTLGDGLQSNGTVFRLATNGTGFQVLHQFTGIGSDGGSTPGALTLGRDGLLYGCTSHGGFPSDAGTVFKLGRDGSGYAVLHRFSGDEQGEHPPAERPLLESDDGFLYGVAGGGANRAGIIFRLNKSGGGYQIIHQFQGDEGTGDSPIGGLVEGCDGALYGTTRDGGIDGAGTVFRLNKDGSGFVVLRIYVDQPNPDDTEGTPTTSLIRATSGQLYGLTSGGSAAEGTLFRFSILPALHIEERGGNVVLSWPDGPETYELEQSDALAQAGWMRVETLPEVEGSIRRATLPRSAERYFFRLRKL